MTVTMELQENLKGQSSAADSFTVTVIGREEGPKEYNVRGKFVSPIRWRQYFGQFINGFDGSAFWNRERGEEKYILEGDVVRATLKESPSWKRFTKERYCKECHFDRKKRKDNCTADDKCNETEPHLSCYFDQDGVGWNIFKQGKDYPIGYAEETSGSWKKSGLGNIYTVYMYPEVDDVSMIIEMVSPATFASETDLRR